MKAPDRIYFDGKGNFSQLPVSTESVAYIRKDIVDQTIETTEDHAYFAGSESMREKMEENDILSKITKEHIDGLKWIVKSGIIVQPTPYHKYCKDLLNLLEKFRNE